jgi:glutamate-5-semialdehyde dehydrogenase
MTNSTEIKPLEAALCRSRQAFLQLSGLTSDQRNLALNEWAKLISNNADFLIAENEKDMNAQKGIISAPLYDRLKLDPAKISSLIQGTKDIAGLSDPVGCVVARTLLDDGLILEKCTVPLGVIAIVFESRPDVIPQILSLALKSGNAVILKGGKEAVHSNQAFMKLVGELGEKLSFLPQGWAYLVDSREAFNELLQFNNYIDLVIPRGSNELVRSVMANTKIPVLGHSEGLCTLYVHSSAEIDKAIKVTLDAKTQYASACNAIETLLVDASIAPSFLAKFNIAAKQAGIAIRGCSKTSSLIACAKTTDADWSTEFGDLTLAVKVVDSLEQAVDHINHFSSHHTDGILASDQNAIEYFLNRVDSASVMANASTRFADGYRYGLGAEVGISTGKIHARGPVGIEGLVTTKYKLRGSGQTVADYTCDGQSHFVHRKLPIL